MTRRLAAIMFTDLVGSTELAQRDERGALALLREQESLAEPLLVAYHGRLVKSTGDGMLIEFPNALDAIECSVAFQGALRDRNARDGPFPLRVRIGLHVGDVESKGTDIVGDAVNVAARIEPLAEPGGICLSGAVHEQTHNKVVFSMERLGPRALKGVLEPVDIFRVVLPWHPKGGPFPPQADRARVAVLPFANLSPDAQDEFFSDGIHDEMIAELTRLPGLQVIARTSVMRYKGATQGVKEIGRDLNVGTVLEGSVRKVGQRIRIICQLIDVLTEAHLWSERFDLELTDIFDVQTEIAKSVATRLGLSLVRSEVPPRPSVGSLDAYLSYLRGRSLWHRRTLAAVQEALQCFEEALGKDPQLAGAASGIADCYLILTNNLEELPWSVSGPKAIEAARKAIALDEHLAEAHASLGLALDTSLEWEGAEREYRRALELNPGYAPAHAWYYLLLLAFGKFAEARSELLHAAELDPLSPILMLQLGRMARWERRNDEALRCFHQVLKLEPGFAEFVPLFEIPALVAMGKREEAAAEFAQLEKIWAPHRDNLEERFTWAPSTLLAVLGRGQEAQASLDRLRAVAQRSYVPSMGIALAYGALGQSDAFFEWIGRAIEDRSVSHTDLRYSDFLGKVRSDPRFPDIYIRCGLPVGPSHPSP